MANGSIEDTSIYTGREEEEGMGWSWTHPFFIVILVATAGLLLFRWKQEITQIGSLDALYMALIIGIMLAKASDFAMRMATPKLVSDPIHTTVGSWGCDYIGNYAVFTIGDIEAYGMHWRGKQGTIVVPRQAASKHGRNWAINTPIHKVEEMLLPYSIRAEVLARAYFKPPYYRGYLTEMQQARMPSVAALIDENKHANMLANAQDEFITKRMKTIDGAVDWAARMRILSAKGTGEKAKEFMLGNKREEE